MAAVSMPMNGADTKAGPEGSGPGRRTSSVRTNRPPSKRLGSNPGSVYRSSASYNNNNARVQWFDDGNQNNNNRNNRLPVRLVW